MLTKMVTALVMSGALWVAGDAAYQNVECCFPGSSCCQPPRECCYSATSSDSGSTPACCKTGEDCCLEPGSCCIK